MSQIHELLAVEGDLRQKKDAARLTAKDILTNKQHLLHGSTRILSMFDLARENEQKTETTEITTTVKQVLTQANEDTVKSWDLKYQKEIANQAAAADIVIDDVIIAKDVPVSFLLTMEEEMKELIKLYKTIPTLPPGITWEKDLSKGTDIYKNVTPQESFKSQKIFLHKELSPATDKQPAQIREWTEERPVGKYATEIVTGVMSVAEKTMLLSRLQNISLAVKKARQRANEQETTKATIGEKLINDITG